VTPAEPRECPPLLGQEEALATLEAAARSGRLHHGWLFCGPPGLECLGGVRNLACPYRVCQHSSAVEVAPEKPRFKSLALRQRA
jgi:hypothetical protein